MESEANSTQTGPNKGRHTGRKLIVSLSVVVGIEALLVSAGAIYFLARMFMEPVENLAGAIVIFLITLAIAVGLVAVTVSCFRNRSWTRGAIVTWQILQFAVATSFIQGLVQWQPVGWVLFLLSAVAIVLVFMPATTKEMTETR